MMDPLTDLARGDKPPGISGLGGGNGGIWTRGQAEAGLYAIGCEANDGNIHWFLGAFGDGK